MRLGYSAWAVAKLPLAEQLAIVRDAGFRGIELVHEPHGNLDARALDPADRRAIREQVEGAGLELTAIAAHGDLLSERADEEAARVAAALDLAAEIGAPVVVCMGYGEPERYEEQREPLAAAFRRLAEHAGRRGVVLALEAHCGQAIDLPEKCVRLIERVGSPHFRLNFDNSHFEVMGRRIDEYVDQLVPYSVHTHLKDQRGTYPDHEFLTPGDGDFDYPAFLRALARAGYRGSVTVEISMMVQQKPGYDPRRTAEQSYRLLTAAAREAGVVFD